MNTTELKDVFREEVMDLETPYLWSDSLVYTYIDEAQKQFCRWTDGIEDARSFTLNILADGTEWYAIDPAILKLRSAIDPSTGNDVHLFSIEKMRDNGLRFDGTLGRVRYLITGMEKGFVRAYPKPNEASTVELRTFRLPLTVGEGEDFEIDEQHHLNLLMWVKYRAYSKQDSEARDDKKAAGYKSQFEAYCAEAKAEQGRVRRPVSTVTYGGY